MEWCQSDIYKVSLIEKAWHNSQLIIIMATLSQVRGGQNCELLIITYWTGKGQPRLCKMAQKRLQL